MGTALALARATGSRRCSLRIARHGPAVAPSAWLCLETAAGSAVAGSAPSRRRLADRGRHFLRHPCAFDAPPPLCLAAARRRLCAASSGGGGSAEAKPGTSEGAAVARGSGDFDTGGDDDSLGAGPILADYLSISHGAGSGSQSGGSSSSSSAGTPGGAGRAVLVQLRGLPAQPPPRSAGEEPPLRERRLVVAALRPGEALGQVQLETPPRAAIANVPRARGAVPELFAESYASFAGRQTRGSLPDDDAHDREAPATPEDADGSSAGSSPGGAASPSSPPPPLRRRLRVFAWHRSELQKLLCQDVLRQFLVDQRQTLGMRPGQPVLWFWEVRRAQEYTADGQVVVLIKYLAETELHMALGPARRVSWPGNMPADSVAIQLRAERRWLVNHWEAMGERLKTSGIEEDAFVRAFLDGRLSWPRARELVGLTALLARPGLAPPVPLQVVDASE
mmetsp:Transcript_107374/g.346741  ORF Transcript_107374/g.346741 Transcript_107374/m.346741 type:complete len:450 (+) Transcript_107374:202-1551(+)